MIYIDRLIAYISKYDEKTKIKDIEFSHYINDIEYYKANVVVKRENDKEGEYPLLPSCIVQW